MISRPQHRIQKFTDSAIVPFFAAAEVLLDTGMLREAGRNILSFLRRGLCDGESKWRQAGGFALLA
jgi:hypothetical protein